MGRLASKQTKIYIFAHPYEHNEAFPLSHDSSKPTQTKARTHGRKYTVAKTWSKKALSKISTLNTSYEIYLLPSARDFELEPFIGKLPQP
jgi:hypothetical protein